MNHVGLRLFVSIWLLIVHFSDMPLEQRDFDAYSKTRNDRSREDCIQKAKDSSRQDDVEAYQGVLAFTKLRRLS